MKTNCAIVFLNWLIKPEHIGYSVVAHNAGKFDAHFLINLLQDVKTKDKIETVYLVDDKPIMKGNRILSCNIKVLENKKWKNITLCYLMLANNNLLFSILRLCYYLFLP